MLAPFEALPTSCPEAGSPVVRGCYDRQPCRDVMWLLGAALLVTAPVVSDQYLKTHVTTADLVLNCAPTLE